MTPTFEWRITYGYGRDRAARIVRAYDVDDAIRDVQAGCKDATIFSVTMRCLSTTKAGNQCRNWTVTNCCRAHYPSAGIPG